MSNIPIGVPSTSSMNLAGAVAQPTPSVPGALGSANVSMASSGMKLMQPMSSISSVSSDSDVVLNKQRLQDLVREVDANEQLDDDVEEMLLQIADDFIENVVTNSCLLAKHRKASSLEVKDVQLNLEKNWNIWIPGFGSDELRPYKKSTVTEAHKQRLALIRKTLKKY